MQVLFISSGNHDNGISPKILSQGESLERIGITVDYYQLQGKGLLGYVKNIHRLRKYLRENKYDVHHAHYSLIGIVASFAGAYPLVVSLMGSDVYQFRWLNLLTRFFARYFWDATIVKSKQMKLHLPKIEPIIIPNGVDLSKFKVLPEIDVRNKFSEKKKHWVLFIGHPTLKEKNYALAKSVIKQLNEIDCELIHLYNIEHDLLPYYMNAASVLIMTSLWEGSPNVIKEAMACNLPIVSVRVGDVEEIISNTKGCFLATYDKLDLTSKILRVVKDNQRTNGREKIKHLEAETIAKKIENLYSYILN